MELNEIRAEVQRRKKRAEQLGIREAVRNLIKHRNQYRALLRSDPKFAARLIYPDIVLSGDEVRFSVERTTFRLTYEEGNVSRDDDWESLRETFTLNVNAEDVIEFHMEKTTLWGEFDPSSNERFGEIVKFIEGPWIEEVIGFWQKVNAYSESLWKERNAPREAKDAEDLKKRFGL